MVKIRIRVVATDGCVASEYIFYLYIASLDLQCNIMIKFIIMFMIKKHKNIEIYV
jgi:hypothetical protein